MTDYGFKGHPLRKDFPLSGYEEVLYNDFYKKLDFKPVFIKQAYRNFNISDL
jgi:NADH:ubiquinone oxidoreductase subunit C